MIKIGGKSYATRKPSDIDAKLLEVTGCDANEIVRNLNGIPLAGTVAAAIMPFLPDDSLSLVDLANLIDGDNLDEARRAVLALYGAPVEDSPTLATNVKTQ